MRGKVALYMPGTDHAGIATQAVVERRLKEKENLTRHDLGRDKLVARIWQWKDEYEKRILGQLARLGCSCDWERTRFTLDEICARAVRVTFFDLFCKQRIYRGKRLVNWDTFLQTAVSDDEVTTETVQGNFWHLRYPVIDPRPGEPTFVLVATTRPETMLGDTAVAVHPDPAAALNAHERDLRERLDKATSAERAGLEAQLDALANRRAELLPRLQQLAEMARAGRTIRLPLVDREIPLVADTWAKPELGSGCVKITPAHDPNDYEVGQRCRLPMINILNPDGTLNAAAGKYQGLTLKKARQQVVADLEAIECLDRVEDREIELPLSDRSKTPIEPYLADQWFVRMAELAQSAIDAVADGRVSITPARYAKGYSDWLGEKRDWPVSRQLWWGHQIPVWSKSFATTAAAQEGLSLIQKHAAYGAGAEIQMELPGQSANNSDSSQAYTLHCCIRDEVHPLISVLESQGFVREQDVLDTWFSSALWPHSTLGWPEKTAELDYFYPTSILITSRDIITLWVARMVLMGLNNLGQIPFHQVYIHPKILDGFGETMSKSKGNGIDPLDVIDKFGPDALRFAMVHLTTETQDVRLPVQFECPHCQTAIDQTKKNRELPRVECPSCKQAFSTQWASTPDDLALPRGLVISERFEVARNFANKLWNAARFAMMRMDGYVPGPIDLEQLTVEDRWLMSRLATVGAQVTHGLQNFSFADTARTLYEFTWQEFCSFYVEMLKDRLSNEQQRPQAQRLLAWALDSILRLLHPIMPFITEEIWQLLKTIAPERGFERAKAANDVLITAPWPEFDAAWRDPQIESQFALFQASLTALREIRARQNIAPRKEVEFVVRCSADIAAKLQPLAGYFPSLAGGKLRAIGPDIAIPQPSATFAEKEFEIFVDLTGLIDVGAEVKRLEKEQSKIEGAIQGKHNKLANEKFIASAPADIVQRERDGLKQLEEQLQTILAALVALRNQK
jgi:valyl-tRNA synthetase